MRALFFLLLVLESARSACPIPTNRSKQLPQSLLNAISETKDALCSAPLERAYLAAIGVQVEPQWSAEETSLVFRALASDPQETPLLVASWKKKVRGPVLQRIGSLFGSAIQQHSTLVVGRLPEKGRALDQVLSGYCQVLGKCEWSRNVWKIVISPVNGLAAYRPPLRELVLSEQLANHSENLARLIVGHELAHVLLEAVGEGDDVADFAARAGWLREGEKWTNRWQESPEHSASKAWNPIPGFTQSENGRFIGQCRSRDKCEGWLFSSTYARSLAVNDPEEDFADAIAAWVFFPNAFCGPDGTVWSPARLAWISVWMKKHFPDAKPVECKKL